MITVEIYELWSADDKSCMYVGQSRSAKNRLSWERSTARRGAIGPLFDWLRELDQTGQKPILKIVEGCPNSAFSNERERARIALRRAECFPLLNIDVGGRVRRGFKRTDEQKERIRVGNLGKVRSVDTRKRLSDSKKGILLSDEHKRKISENSAHRPIPETEKLETSQRMLGNKHALGIKRSPETLAKMRASASNGEKHPRALVTNEVANEIRACVAGGERQIDVARRLGLPPPTVCRIVKGKTYRSMPT